LQKLLLILSFFCCTWLVATSQTIPPAGSLPGSTLPNSNNILSNYQHKVKTRKDSALSTTRQYIDPGPQKKQAKRPNGQDTLSPAPKRSPGLAATDTPPDPETLIPSLDRGSCKGVIFVPLAPGYEKMPAAKTQAPSAPPPAPAPHVPFLQIHGNVLYNLNYYSRIDTPYDERNIYQHTIQTWLDVLVKGQYPFRIYLTNHFSNSSLFRNYSDFNFSYNNNNFSQQIKDQVRKEFLQSLPSTKILDSLQRALNNDLQKLHGLDGGMKNPALIQKAVETREAAQRKIPAKKDSTSAIDADTELIDSIYINKKKEADSLRKEIEKLEQLLQSAHQKSQIEINNTLQNIQKADNPGQIQKEMRALGISDSSLPKGYRTLMAIKSFNLGRTVVNYSELSAKNISINGVQAEYNPSNYYAFASGSVDYRFRDFIVQGPGGAHQYLNVFRVGKGLKDGNSVILTYFTGRRQLYNAGTTMDTTNTQVPSSSLMGLTLEGNYHINKNILLTGELAKSSSPAYTGDSTRKPLGSQLFQMNDHSNEAWALKMNAFFPATQTRVRGTYKHLAANYQSFSIFTDGSSQSAWSANIDQLLFRKQLDIMLGANTNDFSNPFISQEYRSTTVFKSIQATLRRRNWPVISLGYFPSSQITKLGNSQYIENLFYTLVGNMTHSYSYHQILMNTALVYTQFYNRSSDSGFTYFNTRNLMLSQSVFLNTFTLQLNASGAANQDYQLYTLEGKVQHTLSKALTLGAGIKYNKQTTYNIEQMGYSAEAILHLNKLGQLQFSADKGFVPGMNKQLVPDNTGRLTYLKTF
jgi:hypothetical protein